MSKVLYIKANARPDGVSRTFEISNKFIEAYREANPSDEIVTLDLYKKNIDFLPREGLNELHMPEDPEKGKNHPILKYAFQFLESDKYVIAAPMWNLGSPAILKAYIDYITVNGITFKYTANGPIGLCSGKKAVHITGRGGEYSEKPFSEYEMGDRYLRTIFGFLGITDFTTIAANKLDVMGEDVRGIINKATIEAQDLAKRF